MRWFVFLSPLLLAGCSLFYFEVETPTVTIGTDGFEICKAADQEPDCLVWKASEHAGDEGFTLTCEGVNDADCRAVAERAVAALRAGRDARWVVVWPDWHEVCWVAPEGSGCDGRAAG